MVAFEVRAAAGTFCLGVGARCWCVVAIGLWASWVVYLALVAIKYSASNSGSAGRAQENTGHRSRALLTRAARAARVVDPARAARAARDVT